MTGTLFIFGVALLAAAFIGGGLKVSNVVEIPVISTRVGGFGLALVGVVAIALGYQAHYWEAGSPAVSGHTATGAPGSGNPPPRGNPPPAATEPPAPAATTPAPPPDPSVFYAGTVRFDSAGLDFDLAPPRRVDEQNIEHLVDGELYTMSDARMAQWDQQQKPDKAACAQHVDREGDVEVTGLTEGAIVCLRTPHGHVGRLEVQSGGSGVLTAYATVWKS